MTKNYSNTEDFWVKPIRDVRQGLKIVKFLSIINISRENASNNRLKARIVETSKSFSDIFSAQNILRNITPIRNWKYLMVFGHN